MKIMQNRDLVYKEARNKHPERWAKNTRNWALPDVVTLNPDRKDKFLENIVAINKDSTYPHEQDCVENTVIVDKCVANR